MKQGTITEKKKKIREKKKNKGKEKNKILDWTQ
jgi:hypothetical protein